VIAAIVLGFRELFELRLRSWTTPCRIALASPGFRPKRAAAPRRCASGRSDARHPALGAADAERVGPDVSGSTPKSMSIRPRFNSPDVSVRPEVQLTLTRDFKSSRSQNRSDRTSISGEIAQSGPTRSASAAPRRMSVRPLDLTRIDAALQPLGLKPGEAKAMRQEVDQLLKAKFEEFAKNPSQWRRSLPCNRTAILRKR